MKNTLYRIYDALRMLVSPTLERAFDALEAWDARRRGTRPPARAPQNFRQPRTVMANKG